MLTIFSLAIPVLVGAQQNSTPDVVSRLLPNPDNPREVLTVTPSERADVIKQLRTAQAHATGDQLRQTVFLLALLNSDYQRNRDYLIHELRACTMKTIRSGCDENTAAFLIGLFERGHGDVLPPLMLYGTNSDVLWPKWSAISSRPL